MRCDAFMNTGRSFEKWVIVGHWPVVLYGTDRVCANPIIDRQRHIASIDGACVLKDDGQLNALIIPWDGSDSFGYVYYDPFPVHRVLRDQAEGGRSYYIRWGDSRVQVLERGEEFSRAATSAPDMRWTSSQNISFPTANSPTATTAPITSRRSGAATSSALWRPRAADIS